MSPYIEPPRNTLITSLVRYLIPRVRAVLDDLTAQGFAPLIFEARRSRHRQIWLWGIGRTHHLDQRPVTWTLASKHLTGKAADIIEASTLWSDPKFFLALRAAALDQGLHTLPHDHAHVEWRG